MTKKSVAIAGEHENESQENVKPYWEMTTAELGEATKEFDEEFVFERTKPMTPDMKARWERAKAKTAPATNGKSAETISVWLEQDLLARCNALAKKKKFPARP